MKRKISALIFLLPFVAPAQTLDSIKTHVLSEIIIEGAPTEDDTLQNFYKANASATTESILSRMNGVSLIRRGSFGQEPVIRGLSSGQINVTIDGMKIFGACTDKMDPVTIYVEPFNLSAIQARTGMQGAEFGNTFGGSLNMKMAEPTLGIPGISGKTGIDLQTVSNGFAYFSSINVGRSTSAYRASVTYRKNNNYLAGGGKEIPYSQYQKLNAAISGKWAVAKYDTLVADVLVDKGWNIGFPALFMDVTSATAGIYSLTFQRFAPWFIFHKAKVKAYHNTINHLMDDGKRETTIHMDMPGKSITSGFYAEGDVHIFHEHRTIAKLEYFRNSTIGEMTMYPEEGSAMYMQTAPEATRHNAGFYLTQQFRVNATTKLLATYRSDLIRDNIEDGVGKDQLEVIHGNFGSKLLYLQTYGLMMTRNLSSNTKIDLQASHGERAPTLNERLGFYLFNRMDNYDYIGDPGLKKETSWTTEATFNFYGTRTELQVTPFYKHIENYIMGEIKPAFNAMTPGANGVKQYMNINWAKLSGLEVMVLASPAERWQWITTLRYTRGVNALDEDLPLIPPFKAVSTIRYEYNRFNAQAEYEWSARQKNVSESFGEQETKSYALIHVRCGYVINTRFSFNAGVENVFDKNYRDHLDWGGIPRAGRNVYGNVVFKF